MFRDNYVSWLWLGACASMYLRVISISILLANIFVLLVLSIHSWRFFFTPTFFAGKFRDKLSFKYHHHCHYDNSNHVQWKRALVHLHSFFRKTRIKHKHKPLVCTSSVLNILAISVFSMSYLAHIRINLTIFHWNGNWKLFSGTKFQTTLFCVFIGIGMHTRRQGMGEYFILFFFQIFK